MDCEARSQYSVRFATHLLGDDSTVLQEAMDDRKALLVTTPARGSDCTARRCGRR